MPSRFDLVDRIIPDGLGPWLIQARKKGDSFAVVARRLYIEHGIEVTGETVRQWVDKAEQNAAAAEGAG